MSDDILTEWAVLRWPVTASPRPGSNTATFLEPVIVRAFSSEQEAIDYRDKCGSVTDTSNGIVPPYAYAIRKDRWLLNYE
jgi:hypothetical protein